MFSSSPIAALFRYASDDGAQSCAVPCSACPSLATKHLFADAANPRCPAWNATDASAAGDPAAVPNWVAAWPPLDAFNVARTDIGFRNRSSSR